MGQLEKLALDRDVWKAFVGSLWLKQGHKPQQSFQGKHGLYQLLELTEQ